MASGVVPAVPDLPELDAAEVALETPAARPAPPELPQTLLGLGPSLSPAEALAILADREQGVLGPALGIVLEIELLGAAGLGSFAGSPEEAAEIARGCLARVLLSAAGHGGVLDVLGPRGATFIFEGELPAVAERAARAALAMRDAVLEEKRSLEPQAPLALSASASFGSLVAPEEGGRSEGEAVETTHRLLLSAKPGTVLLDLAVAAAVGSRVETRALDGVAAQEAVTARPPPVEAPARLVGREQELAALEASLHKARTGEAPPLLVVGGPGCGKSRLAEETSASAQKLGFLVGLSRPESALRGFPYSILASLLCDLFGVPVKARVERLRPALEAAKVPPPDLFAALVTAAVLPQPPQFTAGQAVNGLRGALAALDRGRGTLLLFDGLDEADETSLESFRRLCELRLPRTLTVGFARPDPIDGRDLSAMPFPVGSLSDEGFRALVHALLGDKPPPDGLCELLSAEKGNAQAIIDRVQLLFERGYLKSHPKGYVLVGLPPRRAEEDLAASRLEAIGPLARRFLEAGCLLGQPFEAAIVEAALQDPRAPAAFSRLERAGLLHALPGRRYALPGDRYRDGLERRMTDRARCDLHLKLAQAIKSRPAEDGEAPSAAEVALHLSMGGNHAAALHFWQRAVDAALSRRDHREATLRLKGLADGVQLALEAGVLAEASGRSQQVQHLSRASAHALASGDVVLSRALIDEAKGAEGVDPVATAEYLLSLARVLRAEKQTEPARKALEAVFQLKPAAPLLILARVEKAEQAEGAGDLAAARASFEEALKEVHVALTLAPFHGEVNLKARLDARLAALLLQQGEAKAALRSFNRSLEAWRRIQHPIAEARLLANLGALAAQSNKPADAVRLFESAAAASERCGDQLFRARQLLNLSKVQRLAGDLAAAHSCARQAGELSMRIGFAEGVKLAQAALQ
jgi:tetratricopeptide (TPR) repeat protein